MTNPVGPNWCNHFIRNSGYVHRRKHTSFLILLVAVILTLGTTGTLLAGGQSDVGAAQALKARDLEKKVKLVTFDPSPEVQKLIQTPGTF